MSEDLAKMVRWFVSAWPSQADRLDAKQAGVYVQALQGLTLDDVKAAMRRFVRGEVAGQDPQFMPPAPAVAAEAVKEQRWRERQQPKRQALPPPIRQFSEAERAQREQLAQWARREMARARLEMIRPETGRHGDPAALERKARADLINRAAAGDEAAIAEMQAENRSIRMTESGLAAMGDSGRATISQTVEASSK